ncbi:MAG: MBL fold metallo-hydrolase [Elusimicrobia bacterium]|nr:MBL fold metallo-hydrolase [Elusimicrobiota bacterium]
MTENLHWLGHASFYAVSKKGTVVYFDPYQLKAGLPKADLILITHDHFDHCSPDDIRKIAKPGTVIVGPASIAGKAPSTVKVIARGQTMAVADIGITAVPSYNTNKEFHPHAAGNVGYVAVIDGVRIYHAGDTDHIPEMGSIQTDVALLPVGGTYTMTAAEAAKAVAAIKPKVVVPMHYGSVVGSGKDAEELKRLCQAEVRILDRE